MLERLSLVIPCYNCAEYIDAHVQTLLNFLPQLGRPFEIILVDDCSKDATLSHLKAWERNSHVRVVALNPNQGKGAAVKAGVLASSGDIVIFTDADLPYDLSAVLQCVEQIENGADVVLGARRALGSVAGQQLHRSVLSRLFAFLAGLTLKKRVPDTQAGFKGFKGDIARRLFADATIERFCFDVEIIAMAQQQRLQVVSMPVTLVNQAPSSVRTLRDGLQMCVDLTDIFLTRRLHIGFAHRLIANKSLRQFIGYGLVGVLNLLLNLLIINLGIILTGISKGPIFLLISFIAFCIVVLHSFIWNKYLVFAAQKNAKKLHHEYAGFFLVSSGTVVVSLSIIWVMVSVIGAPSGISEPLWANIAVLVTIPTAVLCNFFGYKLFVFNNA